MNAPASQEPWHIEPDSHAWHEPSTGYLCLVVRHPQLGHLCGYVALPPQHPRHGHDDMDLMEMPAHGGVTYTSTAPPFGYEHLAANCEGAWWVGFDCAHVTDRIPAHPPYKGDTYRTFGQVVAWTNELALGLAAK